LRDLAAFMMAFEGMYEGFKERAANVKALLSSPQTGFVLVTSPNPLTTQEALFFHRALERDGIRTAAVVVNRVQRDPRRHGGPDNLAALEEALQLAQIKDENRLAERLCETLTEQAILADLDRREIERRRDHVEREHRPRRADRHPQRPGARRTAQREVLQARGRQRACARQGGLARVLGDHSGPGRKARARALASHLLLRVRRATEPEAGGDGDGLKACSFAPGKRCRCCTRAPSRSATGPRCSSTARASRSATTTAPA